MVLSVVVPVYNVEKYLDECVASVLRLKTEFELILVDDGSTDRSGQMCDAWAQRDPRIRAVHQKNGGLSAARNTGIRHSQGDYILFLDSDDYLDPGETDRLMASAAESNDVLMGLYRAVYTDCDTAENEFSPALERLKGAVPIADFLSALPLNGKESYIIAWRFVCRREFLWKNDLMFLPGIYHEDEEWSQRLFCAAAQIYVVPCHFYQYRQARAGSITASRKPKRVYDRFTIIHRGISILETRAVSEPFKSYIRKQTALLYYANMIDYSILSHEDRKKLWPDYDRFSSLLPYANNKKCRLVAACQRILGTKLTCRLLCLLQRILGKK